MNRQKAGPVRNTPRRTNSTSPRKKPTPRRGVLPHPEAASRATRVELVAVAEGRQTTVGLRSLRSGRLLFQCSTIDARGAEFAMLTAERYCAERGYILVMPANDTHKDSAAA